MRSLTNPTDWLDLESELANDLPAEPEALSRVAKAIRKNMAGVCDPAAPLGRFLLVGPPEPANQLARGLARTLFGDERKTLTLEMAEYAEKHQVQSLYGGNGGLVCSHFDGELTEPLRLQPQTVVVLAGIERAHRDAHRLLVGGFADGALIDGFGRTVSLKHAILIATTMVGYPEAVTAATSPIVDNLPWRERFRAAWTAIECEFPAEMLRGTFVDQIVLLTDSRVPRVERSDTPG